MFKEKEEAERCEFGEELARKKQYNTAIEHFAGVFVLDQKYARAALGIAEASMRKLDMTFASMERVKRVEGKNKLVRKLSEEDVEYFRKQGLREAETAIKYFTVVIDLVRKGMDTSNLISLRPNVIRECQEGIYRVDDTSNKLL